jgi:predicted MFS family arabinose efflux permease
MVLATGNIYYAQPLLGEIGNTFHESAARMGAILTLTQLGYVCGLFFVTPLGDVLEKRRLVVTLLVLASIVMLGAALAPNFIFFASIAFGIGVTAVVVQILIPFVALLSTPEERGRNLGLLLSGALIGVLISRTLSGIIGERLGWRATFAVGSLLMLALAGVLRALLPKHEATTKLPYRLLIQSVWHLFIRLKDLRAIAICGALMYAALQAFWASLTFYLKSDIYHLGPQVAGSFGLVGTVGALAANFAGRHASRIGARRLVQGCIALMTIAFIVMAFFGDKMSGLIVGVILLDLGAQAATVSNQTEIYRLHSEAQTRLNTIYKMTYFVGGALGSGLSALGWQHFGWSGVCAVGIFFLLAALAWERFSLLSTSKV